jgi:hypothetical protein
LFADAYIRPVYDGGGNPENDTHDVPFILNTSNEAAFDWDSRNNNSSTFWVVYILTAFQPAHGPVGMGVDGDADWEPKVYGRSFFTDDGNDQNNVGGVLIYLETIREGTAVANTRPGQPEDLERRTVVHEVGHAFHLNHGNYADDYPANGIMNKNGLSGPTYGGANFRFVEHHLDKLRRTEKPAM